MIDNSLSASKSFDEFIVAMKATGCEVKQGKHLAFKIRSGKRFIRCDSLENDYSETALLERISGRRVVTPQPKTKSFTQTTEAKKLNLLIDIQSKIQQGKGVGYEHWASVFNLKEAAKTLIFLQERDLTDYNSLSEKASAATKRFNENSDRRKVVENRLNELTDLQKRIGTYGKTLDVYRQYRDSGWNKKFYTEHESEIILHQAAKKAFDTLGLKKLPTIKALQTEYATLATEKKKLGQCYRSDKDEMVELLMAKQNVERILDMTPQTKKSKEKSEMDI